MIEVKIKYFAVLRGLVGMREEKIECPKDSTVQDLFALLEQKHSALEGKRQRISIAVDHQYASDETVLLDGAEVALLPPVAGGSPIESSYSEELFDVLDVPLQPEKVSALVQGEFGGAIASFVGIVRRASQGRTVERLVYEAYTPMALKEIQQIGLKLESKWPEARVAIHHRIGDLAVGDAAVVIAVCTPHRQAAFDACSFAIERLKETVPIWKEEFFTDGSTWVGWGP